MSGQRTDPYVEQRGRAGLIVWLLRLFFLLVVLTTCLTATFLLYSRFQAARYRAGIMVEGGDPALSPAERLYLQTYLATRIDQLQAPLGSEPATFVIAPGETAGTIAANLAQTGYLNDTTLFLNYLRYYGLDSQLEAGIFQLEPRLTLPELVTSLTNAAGQEIELRFVEGWRLEEMAAHLVATAPGQIDPVAFQQIALRKQPFDLSGYDFLASHPTDATLEGYLFPDTYRVRYDATAADLIDLMLANFGRRVTPAMRQAYGIRGLSLREAVTLASIVEREAVVAAERPLMAGVFYNRLDQGISLDADPTIQYAVGYQATTGRWWKSPLSQADLDLDSPYNTYLYPGLPPGPIANPGLASLQAVASPDESPFIFFVADCTAGDGSHRFSVTYEEHLQHVQRCR